MTLIIRQIDAPTPCDLGAAGVCRVGLAEIVGVWGVGPIVHLVYLGDWCEVAA